MPPLRLRSPTNGGGGGGSYIAHPAPNTAGNEETESKMGATLSLLKAGLSVQYHLISKTNKTNFKTLVIPALISLILYIIISYLLVPLWNRYRGRYSTYLPLESISTRTTSWRERLQSAIVRRLLPSTWRTDSGGRRYAVSAADGSGSDFDEDDGEELYEVDEGRREALSLDARRGREDVDRRLSRDLEEGFKDDSDEEETVDGRTRS